MYHAGQDHRKFGQKLNSLGLKKASEKIELIEAEEQKKRLVRKIDVD